MASKRLRKSRKPKDETEQRSDPGAEPMEPLAIPASLGIDWAAETGQSKELPSESLDIPSARDEPLRQMLGEQVVIHATSVDDAGEEMHEEVVPEEFGGPFVETTERIEVAPGTDPSNPKDAEPEPLPRVVSDTPDLPPA